MSGSTSRESAPRMIEAVILPLCCLSILEPRSWVPPHELPVSHCCRPARAGCHSNSCHWRGGAVGDEILCFGFEGCSEHSWMWNFCQNLRIVVLGFRKIPVVHGDTSYVKHREYDFKGLGRYWGCVEQVTDLIKKLLESVTCSLVVILCKNVAW